MRLLDRYLLRELFLPLVYCLAGFLISFIAFDLFKDIADLQKLKLTAGDIAEYYFNRVPEFLVTSYIMPMSLLLAMLYALTNHARHNELTAMRAAAIPLWRIAAPYFAMGLLFSLAVFYVNERLLPDGLEAAERVKSRRVGEQSKEAQKFWKTRVDFVNRRDNRTWHIGAYHMDQNVMWQPQFDTRRADGTLLRTSAERARWIERRWLFTNVTQQEFSAEGAALNISKVDLLTVPELTETPRIIRSEIKIAALDKNLLKAFRKTHLPLVEIRNYLRLNPDLERDKANALRTMWHGRLAAPWTCVVVVLIAVPFGALPGRRNVFVGVAASVGICFAFFVLKELTLGLGTGGIVPSWLAAWAPNALFAATGLVLMWRVR
jgi:lipopolysaccharide export system permease protein